MFDCIIVGAGPAGGSAAYHLAKKGRSVLVVEKAALPRYKPCGGGVSPVVQEWFDFDFSPAISWKINSLYYTWNQTESIEVYLNNYEPIWMVRREIFDYFLIQQAQKQGAVIQDNTKVNGLKFNSNHWLINTNNDTVSGRYLIAADGGKSVMATWLGFGQRKARLAGALEVEIPVKTHNKLSAYFEFGMVQGGYVWNFPKADGYSLGAGTFRGTKRQNYQQILTKYAQMFEVDFSTGTQCGYPVYLWNGKQKLHTENAVLAGEAACVVDPFTAEGIRPSIFSGIKAALAVDQALSGNINALDQYTTIMNEEWGQEMIWAQRLSQLFYRLPHLGYQLGIKRPSTTLKMMQIMTGKLSYGDVASSAIAKLSRGIF